MPKSRSGYGGLRRFGLLGLARRGRKSSPKRSNFRRSASRSGSKRKASTSRTTTKRRKTEVVQADFAGGKRTYSKVVLGPRRVHFPPGSTNPCNYIVNQSNRNLVASGKQLFWYIDYGNVTDLNACLIIAQKNLSNAVSGGITNAAKGSACANFSYMTQENIFKNQTANQVILTLYDCMLKTNAQAPNTVMGIGTTSNTDGMGFQVADVYTSDTPFYEPTDNSAFNTSYKIVKRTQLILGAGEIHMHKVNVTYNKRFQQNAIAAGAVWGIKGWTGFTLCRAMYGPVVGSTAGNDLGQGDVQVYTSAKYHMRAGFVSLPHTEAYIGVTAATGVDQMVDPAVGEVFKAGFGIQVPEFI